MLFGATKNMRHNVLIRIDKQAAFPADTFPFVFYILYYHLFILNTIWANDCPDFLGLIFLCTCSELKEAHLNRQPLLIERP